MKSNVSIFQRRFQYTFLRYTHIITYYIYCVCIPIYTHTHILIIHILIILHKIIIICINRNLLRYTLFSLRHLNSYRKNLSNTTRHLAHLALNISPFSLYCYKSFREGATIADFYHGIYCAFRWDKNFTALLHVHISRYLRAGYYSVKPDFSLDHN